MSPSHDDVWAALANPTRRRILDVLADRIDLGLNVPGAPGAGRLVVTTGMCTHKVGLRSTDEVEDELVEWLRQAYNRAG